MKAICRWSPRVATSWLLAAVAGSGDVCALCIAGSLRWLAPAQATGVVAPRDLNKRASFKIWNRSKCGTPRALAVDALARAHPRGFNGRRARAEEAARRSRSLLLFPPLRLLASLSRLTPSDCFVIFILDGVRLGRATDRAADAPLRFGRPAVAEGVLADETGDGERDPNGDTTEHGGIALRVDTGARDAQADASHEAIADDWAPRVGALGLRGAIPLRIDALHAE